MKWFTSDWHLNEKRITKEFNPFFRPFSSIREQNELIISNMKKFISPDDELYHLGDVSMDIDGLQLLDEIDCKRKILVLGNYDVDDPEKMPHLKSKFTKVAKSIKLDIGDLKLYLNHYPTNMVEDRFNIVGHIHGLWKVQPNMVNVGVDAWHFRPVSLDEIKFVKTAIEKHYDKNVFPCI